MCCYYYYVLSKHLSQMTKHQVMAMSDCEADLPNAPSFLHRNTSQTRPLNPFSPCRLGGDHRGKITRGKLPGGTYRGEITGGEFTGGKPPGITEGKLPEELATKRLSCSPTEIMV